MHYEDLLLRFPRPRVYATPAVSYLSAEALEQAYGFLRRGWTAGSIARELGYSCGQAFAFAFERVVGENPGEWKKSRGIKTRRVGRRSNVPRMTWTVAELREAQRQQREQELLRERLSADVI